MRPIQTFSVGVALVTSAFLPDDQPRLPVPLGSDRVMVSKNDLTRLRALVVKS
jgi:hypothetical protein